MIEYNIKQKTDEEDVPVYVENISSDDENNITITALEEFSCEDVKIPAFFEVLNYQCAKETI